MTTPPSPTEIDEPTWALRLNGAPDEIAWAYVEHGASILDRTTPGWAKLIDLDELAIVDCSKCIVGQLAEKLYNHTILQGPPWSDEQSRFFDRQSPYVTGADIPSGRNDATDAEEDVTYSDLDDAWFAAVQARLS